MAILVTCQACKQTFRVRDEYLDKKAWCPACRAPITLTGERVSNHEVFISYSNKDKPVADAICAKLEALPLRCWIAPRDVAAGHSWGSSIIEAIEEAKVMVLVYSGSSNLSPQVIREVERAVSKGLVLVPFRIEATMMSKDMEYFLSSSHWIDALTPPLEKHLIELGELVRTVLFRKEKEATAAQKPVQPAKHVPTAPACSDSQTKSRNKLWIAAAVTLVAILGMTGWWFEIKAHQPTNQKAVAATSSVATGQPSLVPLSPKPIETPTANSISTAAWVVSTVPKSSLTTSTDVGVIGGAKPPQDQTVQNTVHADAPVHASSSPVMRELTMAETPSPIGSDGWFLPFDGMKLYGIAMSSVYRERLESKTYCLQDD